MSKKSFKSAGETAVNKFFSTEIAPSAENNIDAPKVLNTPNAPTPHKSSNQAYKDKPRVNLAFDDGLLEYIHIMTRLDGVSLTKYINRIIAKDKDNRASEYQNALNLFTN